MCDIRKLTRSRLDLLHAVYFHTVPMYTSTITSEPDSVEHTPHLEPLEEAPGLDQATLDEISDFIMSIPEMADDDTTLRPTQEPESAVTPSSFEHEVSQWHLHLTQAIESISSAHEGALAYCCGLAAGLHLATTSAIHPHPVRLQTQCDELFKAMSELPDDAWDTFETLHIRM